LAARLVEMSSSLLLEEAEVLAEEPTAEDMEEGEVSAEADPRESRNLCRFLAAKQRILWRACLSGKIHEENSEKMRELSPCQRKRQRPILGNHGTSAASLQLNKEQSQFINNILKLRSVIQ
jgi:hypothetical protein